MPLHIRRIQLRWLGHVQLVGGPGAREHLGIPPKKLEEGAVEKEIWKFLLRLLTLRKLSARGVPAHDDILTRSAELCMVSLTVGNKFWLQHLINVKKI